MNHYDAIIIGFGKAGKTLAPQIAAQGKKVAIIEKSPLMYGGTCPNVGCIPSKALISSAQNAKLNTQDWTSKQKAYRNAISDKNHLTSVLRMNMFNKISSDGVEIIDGFGSFENENTLKVQTADGEIKLTADKFFINTGAESFIPPISGIDTPKAYTSETLMNLPELPQTLVIIGGGYIGLEFASMYANFGSKVIILQDITEFLPRDDEDIAQAILERLKDQGVEFHFGVKVEELIDNGNLVEVKYLLDNHAATVKADAVLIATGRRPNTKGLEVQKAGIELTPYGAIKVNEKLQTSNPSIWAMGDVTGGLQFTYISLDDSRIVGNQIFATDKKYTVADRQNVPFSVFLDPPYSRVGLNEKEALEKGYEIKVAKMSAGAIPRAKAIKQQEGVLKVIINAKTSEILGAMLFCAESYEVINLVKLAMDNHLPYTTLRDMIYTHPTMSEAMNDLLKV